MQDLREIKDSQRPEGSGLAAGSGLLPKGMPEDLKNEELIPGQGVCLRSRNAMAFLWQDWVSLPSLG